MRLKIIIDHMYKLLITYIINRIVYDINNVLSWLGDHHDRRGGEQEDRLPPAADDARDGKWFAVRVLFTVVGHVYVQVTYRL